MVDITPGDDSGANKGYWKKQLRDRFGKFVKEGGEVIIDIQIPGVVGKSRARGIFIENETPEIAIIEVLDNSVIPKGLYKVHRKNITGVKAPEGAKAKITPKPAAKKKQAPKKLVDSISGLEVHKKKLSSITKILKSEGRFAVPRQTSSDNWGSNSDVSRAAKANYEEVYNASDILRAKYKSPDELWERVKQLSVGTDAQSPNDLAQIPEDMKEINREYAVHFLGLKSDGMLTVYRNAVNNKNTEIDAAAGYVSTDRDLAYDYNSGQQNIATNGRYEIDVKPDEIVGMIGYSNVEDEFAFVIGTGVTSQPGRVRRVGDIRKVPLPAPWLEQYEKTIVRSQGATPYRHHALGGQFDFHEVDNFGEDLAEFFAKHNAGSEDIKTNFDKLYGAGSYDEYRESGNTITFQTIRKMFVDLPSGKIGLDITKIPGGRDGNLNQSGYGDTQNPKSFKNDRTDNTLKMLAVFQEITGQPFFTHRSRDYVPELANTVPKLEFTPAEYEAIKWYTDQGYDELNKHLREGAPISPEGSVELQSILGLLDRSPLENPMTVYRGRPVVSSDRLAELEALKPGDKLTDKGIMSTSYSKEQAEFYAEMPLTDSLGKFMLEIDLPAGAKAFAIPDHMASYGDIDKEVLLPPDLELEVVDVTTNSSGVKTIKLKPAVPSINEPEPQVETPTQAPESSRLTSKRAVEIWDSALNERGAYEFDEDAADVELYDLMLQEGVSSKELAMANPVYRDYLKTLEFREKEDESDHQAWALDFIKNVRRSWNGNPKLSGLILAMQPVAEEVFGLQGTSNPIQELSSATKKEIDDYTKFSKPALEAFVKASHKNTQKFFEDRGIKTLVVYRGVINSSDNSYLTEPTEINIDVRPMSSWTADPEIAKAYAPPGGVLLRAEIPISQVLSTAFSGGMGTLVEREVVLLGPPEKILGVVGSEHRKLVDSDSDAAGVIDVVSEEAAEERIEPGFDNWMPVLFDLLDSFDENEYGDDITNNDRGNILQSRFLKASGFNKKPELAAQEEFDAIASETLYRAVVDKSFVDDYLNSDVQFAGEGVFGNGTYTSNNKDTVRNYAGVLPDKPEEASKILEERTMELKLSPDANVVDLSPDFWSEFLEKQIETLRNKALEFGANPAQMQAIDLKLTRAGGWSNIAIMLGYDAFRVKEADGEYYTVILNRGKVIVNGKS